MCVVKTIIANTTGSVRSQLHADQTLYMYCTSAWPMYSFCFQTRRQRYLSDIVETPLSIAIDDAKLDVVRLLIEHGADLELNIGMGETALFRAVKNNNVAAAELLIVHGTSVNHQTPSGETPLGMAAFKLNTALIRLLLRHGADVNIGRSKLESACYGLRPCPDAFDSGDLYVDIRRLSPDLAQRFIERERAKMAALLARLTPWRDVIKLLLPLCDSFDVRGEYDDDVRPCTLWVFEEESTFCPHDLALTKHLLRNGVTSEFNQLFQHARGCGSWKDEFISDAFLKLVQLSGCSFDTFRTLEAGKRTGRSFREVDDKVEKLLSQPLSMRELCIMTTRRRIGKPHLWVKIDTLPIPSAMKDALKLTMYGEKSTTL